MSNLKCKTVALCAAGEIASRTRPNSIRQVRSRLPRVTRWTRQALQRGNVTAPLSTLKHAKSAGITTINSQFQTKTSQETYIYLFIFYKIPIANGCCFLIIQQKGKDLSNF